MGEQLHGVSQIDRAEVSALRRDAEINRQPILDAARDYSGSEAPLSRSTTSRPMPGSG
jgi:hypothetical protein